MKVLIVGGGIGGLSAALCCLHHGHDVIVLEKATEFQEIGAGLQISPNAVCVLQALGLEQEIAEMAFEPKALETRMGETGRQIFRVPLSSSDGPIWGKKYYHIHRADYIYILSKAVQSRASDALKMGVEVKSFTQSQEGVSVQLDTGEALEGDILIGADGIHSCVRKQMFGIEQSRFTGNLAWRAVVPVERLKQDAPPPTACVWMGKGKHAVTYLLRQGKLANFVGVVERDDWTKESWYEDGAHEEALADFSGWPPTITRLIKQADTLHRWALYDRAPLQSWSKERVTLLGDAAHPMLPFMAQGAAMAVEDAWVLASELTKANNRPVKEALLAYEAKRLPRTSKVQVASTANAKTFHRRTVLARASTYGPMWLAGRVAPAAVKQRFDWIYNHDVTA